MAHPSASEGDGGLVSATLMHEDTEHPLLPLLGLTGMVAEVSVTGKDAMNCYKLWFVI